MLRRSYCIFVAQGIKRRFSDSLNSYSNAYLFTDSEKLPLTPLCIEDAERVEDPILFERPCNPEGLEVILKCVLHEVQRTVPKASILASTLCIEDARSLVLRLEQPSAS